MNVCSQGSVKRVRRVILSPFVLATVTSVGAFAQQPPAAPPGVRLQQSATVTTEAPIYLLPDDTRKPLRMLAPGTSLVVQRAQDDWLEVSFNDPQFGRRIGWIQQKFVKVSAAKALPPEPVPSQTKPRDPKTAAPSPRPRWLVVAPGFAGSAP